MDTSHLDANALANFDPSQLGGIQLDAAAIAAAAQQLEAIQAALAAGAGAAGTDQVG